MVHGPLGLNISIYRTRTDPYNLSERKVYRNGCGTATLPIEGQDSVCANEVSSAKRFDYKWLKRHFLSSLQVCDIRPEL